MTAPAPLEYRLFHDVVLTFPQPAAGGDTIIGGLAFPQNFPDFARHNRRGRPCDMAPPSFADNPCRLAGNYMYGGPLFEHFGHLITECPHRLWVQDIPTYQNWPVLFLAAPDDRASISVIENVMNLFGIKKYHIIREDVMVERLLIAETGKQFTQPPHPAYVNWLKRRVPLSGFADERLPKKLCIMRSHLWSGRLFGESIIEDWLEADGYHILRPEKHPLKDQLKYLASAEMIVFSEGSAIHLLDLLPPLKAKAAVLLRRPNSRLPKSSLAPKVASCAIFADVSRALHMRNRPKLAPHNALSFAPLDEIRRFLIENRFLSGQTPAYGYPKKAYSRDLLEYSDTQIYPQSLKPLPQTAKMDRAIEDLLREHRDVSRTAIAQRYRLAILSAHFGYTVGDYEKALAHIKLAIHLKPWSEPAKQLRTLLEKALDRRKTFLGRVIDWVKRTLYLIWAPPSLPPDEMIKVPKKPE